jgi:hypothetical protein
MPVSVMAIQPTDVPTITDPEESSRLGKIRAMYRGSFVANPTNDSFESLLSEAFATIEHQVDGNMFITVLLPSIPENPFLVALSQAGYC